MEGQQYQGRCGHYLDKILQNLPDEHLLVGGVGAAFDGRAGFR
jgi:hypothetical protein